MGCDLENLPEETRTIEFTVSMKKIGLIINPIAGMGGAVGLKGTDGSDALREAIARGAIPKSEGRAKEALKVLSKLSGRIEIVTFSGNMGENVAKDLGYSLQVVGIAPENTTAEDTRRAATLISKTGVDLLLFAGGDGTARDIYQAIGDSQVTLGIPTGVKMHSAVFAISPKKAGEVASLFMERRMRDIVLAEIIDVDEIEFRRGKLSTELVGYMRVPWIRTLIQGGKVSSEIGSEGYYQEAIAEEVLENLIVGRFYIVGPGTTAKAVMKKLCLDYALLGVDVFRMEESPTRKATLIGTDLSESEILRTIEGSPVTVIISPIGGQGFLFGRGNQQISSKIVKEVGRDDITIISTPTKLAQLKGAPLLIDTGDEMIDKKLSGYHKVITGYRRYTIYKAVPG